MQSATGMILSIPDFTETKNGGGLWSANLLESLSRVPGMQFSVVSIGPENIRAPNAEFVRRLEMEHLFVPFRAGAAPASGKAAARILTTAVDMVREKFYFPWEQIARREARVESEVLKIIADRKPDIIIINYLFTALFAPSVFELGIPCCLITLNDEAEFQRALKAQGGPVGGGIHRSLARMFYRHFNWIPNRRVARYEKATYGKCAGIAALTRNDLPGWLPEKVATAVLPPLFAENTDRWQYGGNRHVFFVGTIGYYPNRLAIEWLCTRLAPELQRADATIRINIIGASAAQALPDWRRPNVNFMGFSNREEVVRQMTNADLFIAPIANTFGAKIKLAECVSYGMPFLASPAAMSGLPHLQWMPQLDLEQPVAAARQVAQYLDDGQLLQQLSRSIAEQTRLARAQQPVEWEGFLQRSMGNR